MKSRYWLLLAVVPVILGAYALKRSLIPASVSGGEVPTDAKPAPAPPETKTPPVWLPALRVDDFGPRPAGSVSDKGAGRISSPGPDPGLAAVRAEQDELRIVDVYAVQERRKIETWYSDKLAELEKPPERTQRDRADARERLAREREQKLAAVQAEVDRRTAVIALRRARARTELARELSGDRTPIVEAVTTTDNGRLCALIGDTFVFEGSTVQGYRVRKIFPGRVEFEKDGKVWVQKIN
jgi:hypothetical protein